jgi:cell division protein FtsI/penicillin-binding protein 2
MSQAFIQPGRYGFVVAIVCFAFLGLVGRLTHLHVWEHDRLGQFIERSRNKFDVLCARRGSIVDSRGNVLATTRSVIELGVDPMMLVDTDHEKWPLLAEILDMPLSDIELIFAKKTEQGESGEVRQIRWKKIAEAIDEGVYLRVLGLEIKGVYGNRHYVRTYPGDSLAAHVLGFVNKENHSVGGIEQSMDFYLRGQDGWRQTERDGKRRELSQFRTREVDPTNGLNLELTLDWHVQHIIEKELMAIVEKYHPTSATIIVSEPATGAILGLANVPTFNPNEFFKANFEQQRNRAITDLYEPGSTFKIVPISAALEDDIVDLDQIFDCTLTHVEYLGRKVALPKDHRNFNHLTMREVITKSSNRGVAQLGMMMGAQTLYDYASSFGYGHKTGLGLVGEVSGILHPVKHWDGLTISRLPMGHALGATPIQVHQAMATVANQGVLTQPQLVRRVFDDKGETVLMFDPVFKRRVVSSRTAKTISEVLVTTVSPEGTSVRAQIPDYEVAGKSGTSQKIINGQYSHNQHVGSFSGFFPASRPRLVVTIVVDDPKIKGVGYGSVVAAPSFKNIAQSLIRHYGIEAPGKKGILAKAGGLQAIK